MTALCQHDATGDPLTPEEWAALDRYVAGEGSGDEREVMRQLIQTSPQLAAIVEVMRSSRRGPGDEAGGPPNTAAAWHALSAKLGFDSPSQRERRRAPLALMSPRSRRDSAVGRVAGLAAAMLIIAGASLVSWRALRTTPRAQDETQVIRADYRTARGERATIELRDGTRVTLAPETHLRIAQTDRQVYLSGEAVFAVTHDAARPFSVIAADGSVIRDIGTQFDVRDYPTERTVRVVVADGSVSLRSPLSGAANEPVILPRGTEGVVDSVGAVEVTPNVSPDHYLAWAQGRLAFTNARMADVVVELSRWYDLDIRLGSQKLADVGLTVTLNDSPADIALDVIARAIDARVVRTGQSATLYPRGREGSRE